jgi:hypothetical protein
MMRTVFMSVLALGLGACSADDAVDCGDCVRPGDDAQLFLTGETSSTAETPPNTIPARFHGVWDVMDNMGSCEEWSDMRLEIAPRQITFHESSGDVTKVSDKGDVVMIEVSGEAEGESLTDSFGLKLDDKGQLVIVDPDGPPWGEVYPRGRCPA